MRLDKASSIQPGSRRAGGSAPFGDFIANEAGEAFSGQRTNNRTRFFNPLREGRLGEHLRKADVLPGLSNTAPFDFSFSRACWMAVTVTSLIFKAQLIIATSQLCSN
nr:hypothetical protein [Oxalobacteraceae bacterium]